MRVPVKKEKNRVRMGGVCAAVLALVLINGVSYGKGRESVSEALNADEAAKSGVKSFDFIKEQVLSLCAPVFEFGTREFAGEYGSAFEKALLAEVPFFSYMIEDGGQMLPVQDEATWEWLLASNELAEGDMESEDVSGNSVSDNSVSAGDMLAEAESADAAVGSTGEAFNPDEAAFLMENENARALMETEGMAEAQVPVADGEFIPHTKQVNINLADYQEFSDLFDAFYAMDSNTMVGRDELNTSALLEPNVTIDKSAVGPQILIYHTHSQETFADSVPGDKSTSIVGAGEKLTRLLTEKYGYSVLHHTGEYDVGDRDNAYSKSLPALEQILAENPSIQVVIDLHRDGVAEDRKLMVDLDGRPTAQFMFFNGLSRTKNTGDIDYLYNPYQQQNLALSFQMQLAVDEYYPGLARRIYLNGYRYNMHLRPSLLVELGAQTNTVEEIMNAVDPLAHVLDLVFSGKNAR